MRVTFLGTGTSRGVPLIGCGCKVCTSSNPKNKRLRPSILIESQANVVIDTSVDFRVQMLQHKVQQLDAIVYTHPHVDHILGLDDVYPFNFWSGKSLPIYGSAQTLKEVRITFRYLFEEERYPGTADVELIPIEGTFRIGDLEFQPIQVFHGQLPVLGFRVGRFAYVTDVSHIPEESLMQLQGLDCLVLDGLRYESHPTHFSLSQAAETAHRLGAHQTFLIHMTHEVDHDEGNTFLPESVKLAYDGQVLEF